MNKPLTPDERENVSIQLAFMRDGDLAVQIAHDHFKRLSESEAYWREAVKNVAKEDVDRTTTCPFCLEEQHTTDCPWKLAQDET